MWVERKIVSSELEYREYSFVHGASVKETKMGSESLSQCDGARKRVNKEKKARRVKV